MVCRPRAYPWGEHLVGLLENIRLGWKDIVAQWGRKKEKSFIIVSNPQVKQLHSFNQVYSMIPSIKSAEYLCEITTGENRVGSKRRVREREREQQINGVRDGAFDRNGNGVSWKWPLVKKDTWVFLAK
jgi:hypothetical protein